MSKTITTAKIRPDGTVIEVLEDGTERPFPDTPMRPMTDEEIHTAALADPDAQPLTEERPARMKLVPRARSLWIVPSKRGRAEPTGVGALLSRRRYPSALIGVAHRRVKRSGTGDGLTEIAALGIAPAEWPGFPAGGLAPEMLETIRRGERTVRPVGDHDFIPRLEKNTYRTLARQKPGAKATAG